MFVGDFNSKLESLGCAKKNTSGPMLQNIQNQLNLIYLNSDEHTHMDRANGSTDILDMAFISPKLAKHDIQFQIGDDLLIEISIDTPPPPPPPHTHTHTHIGTHLLTTWYRIPVGRISQTCFGHAVLQLPKFLSFGQKL